MKWKKSVDAAKKANRAPMASPSGTPAAPSPAPAANATSQVYKGDPEKRTFTIDGVDNKRTGDAVRDGCIGLLYNGLAYRSTDPIEDVLMKAIEIEKAGYDHFNGPTDAYRKKIRSLFQNLKNKTNRELGIKLMANDITAVRFIKMTHEELKSAEMKKQEEKLEAENMKKAQVPMAEKSISTALTCGKCGQKKVSYTQAQTRSADEPMTTFCECLICGNRWKVSDVPCRQRNWSTLLTMISSLELQSYGCFHFFTSSHFAWILPLAVDSR